MTNASSQQSADAGLIDLYLSVYVNLKIDKHSVYLRTQKMGDRYTESVEYDTDMSKNESYELGLSNLMKLLNETEQMIVQDCIEIYDEKFPSIIQSVVTDIAS
jgi:hypothetical protein